MRKIRKISWSIDLSWLVLIRLLLATAAEAQTPSPSPTPADKRGLGIQSSGSTAVSQTNQQSREAKPELVLQSGYNNFFGATRLTFSPDGRLLATGTFRSSTIKLWETATGRELRDLSTGSQSAPGLSPVVAFSRDSRVIAAAAGDNTVKVWDVITGRELQTLAGPQGSIASSFGVYFLAFASDNRLVTVSDSVRVWDLATGRALLTLEKSALDVSGFTGSDSGIVLSADGKQIALISEDPRPAVRILDLATGREVRSFNLPDKQIESIQLSFTADGQLLAAGTIDKQLKTWNLTSKSERDVGPTAKDFPQLKLSRDGRLLALSENYTVRLREVATGRELPALKVPNSGAFGSYAEAIPSFSEDGKRIATGGFDTQTVLWDAETGKELIKMNGRTNMAHNAAFSADGNLLSSGGRTARDLRTGRGLRLAAGSLDRIFAIPSPDGKLLAMTKPNSSVLTILETTSGRQLRALTPGGDIGVVQRTRFSKDGSLLIVTYGASDDQKQTPTSGISFARGSQVKIWDVKSGQELRSLVSSDIPLEADFSADGRVVGTIASMGQISLWDAQSGSKLRDLTSSPLSSITSPGGLGNLGNLGSLGNIKPGSIPSMPNIAEISGMMTNMMGGLAAGTMGRTVTSLAFSPDGRVLATGGVETKSNLDFAAMIGQAQQKPKKGSKPPDPDEMMKNLKVEVIGQVLFWDVATGTQIGAIKGHGKGVTQVAFSRDGKLLASSSSDNTIKIWDVATRKELRTLTGHTANIESMDFSHDSRLLASASEDGGTFLWDATTGEHLLTLISLDDGAEWMVVTPQGLFDGTPPSWNQILWRYNQDTFNVAPIEWFFNEFYYPGLLAEVFAGKRPRVAEDVSKKDRRQPIVKLSIEGEQPLATGLASRTVKVRIEVSDAPADKDNPQGCGARDVRLFRNGALVKA